jgi:hypothetical protein
MSVLLGMTFNFMNDSFLCTAKYLTFKCNLKSEFKTLDHFLTCIKLSVKEFLT